jgi:hypothetical protein
VKATSAGSAARSDSGEFRPGAALDSMLPGRRIVATQTC